MSTVKRHTTCRGVLRDKCREEAQAHIFQIYQYQQQQEFQTTKTTHVVFAVVRDPISRFISAMGQAMDVELGAKLRDKCLNENSANITINCVLQELQQRGLRMDVHFCPMVVNLYVLTRNHDVQVSLFLSHHLQSLLHYLGSSAALHMRDRSNPEYTKSELLSKLSIDDLDSDMIRIICELYSVDVLMLKSIGLDVPLCTHEIPITIQ